MLALRTLTNIKIDEELKFIHGCCFKDINLPFHSQPTVLYFRCHFCPTSNLKKRLSCPKMPVLRTLTQIRIYEELEFIHGCCFCPKSNLKRRLSCPKILVLRPMIQVRICEELQFLQESHRTASKQLWTLCQWHGKVLRAGKGLNKQANKWKLKQPPTLNVQQKSSCVCARPTCPEFLWRKCLAESSWACARPTCPKFPWS